MMGDPRSIRLPPQQERTLTSNVRHRVGLWRTPEMVRMHPSSEELGKMGREMMRDPHSVPAPPCLHKLCTVHWRSFAGYGDLGSGNSCSMSALFPIRHYRQKLIPICKQFKKNCRFSLMTSQIRLRSKFPIVGSTYSFD